jgi:hypothetical protein
VPVAFTAFSKCSSPVRQIAEMDWWKTFSWGGLRTLNVAFPASVAVGRRG